MPRRNDTRGLLSLRVRIDDAKERFENLHDFSADVLARTDPTGIHTVPGQRFLIDHSDIQNEFAGYLALIFRNRLQFAIETQRFANKYKPLSDDYSKYKEKYFDGDVLNLSAKFDEPEET